MNVIIKLNDTYRLSSEPKNIILERKVITEKGANAGKEYWITVGNYPDLEWALAGIFKRQIETSETEGIKELIQEIKNGVRAILEQIEVLKGE